MSAVYVGSYCSSPSPCQDLAALMKMKVSLYSGEYNFGFDCLGYVVWLTSNSILFCRIHAQPSIEKNLAALQNAPKSFLKVVDNQRGVITTHPIHKGQFVVQYAEEFGTIKPA